MQGPKVEMPDVGSEPFTALGEALGFVSSLFVGCAAQGVGFMAICGPDSPPRFGLVFFSLA